MSDLPPYLFAIPAILWLAVAFLPWRPWSNREVLEAVSPCRREDLSGVTVLIPARDEARVIGRTLSSVAAQGDGLSVVLVDDGSTDGTAERARLAGPEGLRVVAGVPPPPGWSGKLWALEQGRRRVRTAYTLLLDADIELAPGMICALLGKMRKEGISFLSLMAAPPMGSFREKLLLPAFVYFFKLLYPFRLANSPSSRVAAAAGGCILMETRLFEGIGGLETIKEELIDDCALARRVKEAGGSTWVGVTRSVRTVRPYNGLGEIRDMVARTAYTQLRYSGVLLALCTVVMAVAFLLPVAGLASASGPARWASAGALGVMCLTYMPTLAFYGRSPAWSLCLPGIAMLYLFMTWTSAVRFWKGERSRWKGRVYAAKAGRTPPPGPRSREGCS